MDRYKTIIGMIPKNTRVLDYGCGDGSFVERLKNNGNKAVGVDLDTELKIKDMKDNGFDVVTSICVLEHTVNPGIYLDDVKRVLKKDGLFIVCVPISISFNSILSQLFFNKSMVKSFTNIANSHVVGWDASTFTKLMDRMGFIYMGHVFQGGSSIGKLHIPFFGLRYNMIFKYKTKEE